MPVNCYVITVPAGVSRSARSVPPRRVSGTIPLIYSLPSYGLVKIPVISMGLERDGAGPRRILKDEMPGLTNPVLRVVHSLQGLRSQEGNLGFDITVMNRSVGHHNLNRSAIA